MSDIFPKWTNQLPLKVAAGVLLTCATTAAAFWYYFTPKYTQVGYQPRQPVSFSHATHAGQLGLDCRYCHTGVEKSAVASLPTAASCMNCHNQALANDPRLVLVHTSAASGKSIPWMRVHRLPDYVFFDHVVHVKRGVGCGECHGEVNRMEETWQARPFSMAFCLDCHRRPAPALRPPEKVTDLVWNPQQHLPADWGAKTAKEGNINPSQNCSACHR